MSDSTSLARPVSEAARFGPAKRMGLVIPVLFCAGGALWAAVLLLHVFAATPRDSATACRREIYRDPVTGQERGVGETRIAADGRIACHGVTYPAVTR
jgi:hypothetical protein